MVFPALPAIGAAVVTYGPPAAAAIGTTAVAVARSPAGVRLATQATQMASRVPNSIYQHTLNLSTRATQTVAYIRNGLSLPNPATQAAQPCLAEGAREVAKAEGRAVTRQSIQTAANQHGAKLLTKEQAQIALGNARELHRQALAMPGVGTGVSPAQVHAKMAALNHARQAIAQAEAAVAAAGL